nr:hypothetical protein [Mucilaginibacter sp. FT3.2]
MQTGFCAVIQPEPFYFTQTAGKSLLKIWCIKKGNPYGAKETFKLSFYKLVATTRQASLLVWYYAS